MNKLADNNKDSKNENTGGLNVIKNKIVILPNIVVTQTRLVCIQHVTNCQLSFLYNKRKLNKQILPAV